MAQNCGNCGAEVPLSGTACQVCQEPVGFPNVRTANLTEEKEALARRATTARDSAAVRQTIAELQDFETRVAQSKAVMNRSLGALSSWINGDSPLFQSFHKQVKLLGRIPDTSHWDQQRASAESTINPFSYEEINFSALTIDDNGMEHYGPYSVVLREPTIENRASVFEENPFIFNMRHNVVSGTKPPLGYRATWDQRQTLAVAKLHSEINQGMADKQFAAVLMKQAASGADNDFIEVHIYGPIHRKCIEKVSGPDPKPRVERSIWRQAAKALRKDGAVVEEK
ncbi:hypothetical protein [Methylobacterium longum]|uniref:Zinc ribbon domain-containing protein n=1 Tax=Methylobacterium longum TaxID=767694 RepID=A0ABT8AWE5_9HYPH|nr:hypothetical protein [Methylobacterium longum]MDN3574282.1 hypothetical protein [Methylobacterium longum]GJE13388.1 hypothetical protein FOHLNKBM_4451 [Methylobacterium longum]